MLVVRTASFREIFRIPRVLKHSAVNESLSCHGREMDDNDDDPSAHETEKALLARLNALKPSTVSFDSNSLM